jgi:uncharacterized protein
VPDKPVKKMTSTLVPVAPRERVATIDVLRGFALSGVLLANLFWLYSARQFERPSDTRLIDGLAGLVAVVLVHGKAQTLLTFLFGFGFAVQLLRARTRDERVLGLYVRRLVVLFCIGSMHVTLLWWGDVTWHYALCGFVLLLFLGVSDRWRIAWAALLIFVPTLLFALPRVSGLFFHREWTVAQTRHFLAVLHGPSYRATIVAHPWFALVYVAPSVLMYFPWIVGRFLVGLVAGTQRWFDDDGAHRVRFFRRLLGYGLLCNLPSVIALLVAPRGPHRFSVGLSLIFALLEELGTLGLTASYVALVVLLMQRPSWRGWLLLVAPVGRMPLTTYLSQSLICTALFYGWGLGLAGHVSAAGCVGMAVVIFAAQVLACHVWLSYFRFGPLEWVWRTLVYLRRQPLREHTENLRAH